MNNLDNFLKQFQNELDKQDESATKSSFSSYHKKGDFNDVPTNDDDDDYKTHLATPFSEASEDAKEDEKEKTAKPPEGDMPEESEIEDDMENMSDQGVGNDQEMSGIGGGMGGDMLGQEEEDEGPKSKEEVGQAYEMKKIYSRMVSIEQFLNTASDENLVKVRTNLSKAIELFRTVISNFDLYKEKIDDIIVQYYKFIVQVYDIITKHFKAEKNK